MIFRCFRDENLRLLNPTALEVNEAFFLATHSPQPLGRVRAGAVGAQQAAPYTEAEFEAVFRDPAAPFVFAVVHGSTGSGKSHLIRWLYTRLRATPLPDTRLFLIPRAGANLRQIIERIVRDLPGEFFDQVRQDLSRGQERFTDKGLRESLLDTLAVHVDPASFADRGDPLAGLSGEARDNREYLIAGLPDLFRDRRFRRHFTGEGDIIDELVSLTIGAGGSRAGRERPRQFTEGDFRLTDKLTPEDLRSAATDETLQFAIDLSQSRPLREDAAAYVNGCLPAAIQGLLDLRGTNFTEIFRNVRRALGPSRQLILLIEDIAAFEFIDRQLLEALIEQPVGDLCPLKSAVGVTDGYLERIDPTHLERSTLRVTLNASGENPDDYRVRFAASYLNALRLELPLMERHASAGTSPELPSACATCPYRPHCHASFPPVGGGEGAVGLFPFNPNALAFMQKATHGTHSGVFNPRAFIDGVLRATLDDQKEAFDEGRFPSRAYRTQFGPVTTPAPRVEALKREFGPQHYEQALVIQELWGDVPTGVYETFKVPVKAQLSVTAPAMPPGTPDETPALDETVAEPAPLPHATPVDYPTWLAEALAGLDSWYSGSELPAAARDTVRRVLRSAILAGIDWDGNGLRQADWSRPFEAAAVNFEGQRSTLPRTLAVTVPRKLDGPSDIPSALALQGLLLAGHHGGWDFVHEGQDGIYYLQLVGPFVERLAEEVLGLIRTYPAKGKAFDPLPPAVETLTVAALFQGHMDESSCVDAWLDAAVAPRVWTANPIGPTGEAFKKLVDAFGSAGAGQGHALLRETVLKALGRGEGESCFLDAAAALPVLERLRASGSYAPGKFPADLQAGWESLKHLRRAIDQHLRPFLEDEVETLRAWLAGVDESLGGLSKAELIREARSFIDRAERLKAYSGFRPPASVSAEEFRDALRDFESAPFDEAVDAARSIVRLAESDLPADGPPRLDRLLPRIARLRHDVLESWDTLRHCLDIAVPKTEQHLTHATPHADANDLGPLRAEALTLLERLAGQYEVLRRLCQ